MVGRGSMRYGGKGKYEVWWEGVGRLMGTNGLFI